MREDTTPASLPAVGEGMGLTRRSSAHADDAIVNRSRTTAPVALRRAENGPLAPAPRPRLAAIDRPLCDDQDLPTPRPWPPRWRAPRPRHGPRPRRLRTRRPTTSDDPNLWLEDVLGDKALAWVRERNAQSRKAIEAWPQFTQTRDQLRAILDSKEQIPGVVRRGDWFWNFWRDDKNPRGLWRRTTLDEYRKPQPHGTS